MGKRCLSSVSAIKLTVTSKCNAIDIWNPDSVILLKEAMVAGTLNIERITKILLIESTRIRSHSLN
ncbi:hypothetical protein GCM10023151_15730 [Kangiella marina]|uniref:Uncharacterized protein n=1 Tax=Kangiella marina TaxID=1079178 RepID=A0ABP8IKY1_9GAMM